MLMKYLVLIAGIFIFGSVSAQNDEVYYLQKQLKKQQQKKINPLYKHQSPVALLLQKDNYSDNDVAYTLPDGNKVTALSQDKMPCVVPDMSQFNMPCIVPKKQTYTMPVLKNKSK